jgi:hypothetical protein
MKKSNLTSATAQSQREAEERFLEFRRALRGEEITTAIFWPPLNPDPDCTMCGGTGYRHIKDDAAEIDIADRCPCNIRHKGTF